MSVVRYNRKTICVYKMMVVIRYSEEEREEMEVWVRVECVMSFFFKQKTAYEISACHVGSEMCIRDGTITAQRLPRPPRLRRPVAVGRRGDDSSTSPWSQS